MPYLGEVDAPAVRSSPRGLPRTPTTADRVPLRADHAREIVTRWRYDPATSFDVLRRRTRCSARPLSGLLLPRDTSPRSSRHRTVKTIDHLIELKIARRTRRFVKTLRHDVRRPRRQRRGLAGSPLSIALRQAGVAQRPRRRPRDRIRLNPASLRAHQLLRSSIFNASRRSARTSGKYAYMARGRRSASACGADGRLAWKHASAPKKNATPSLIATDEPCEAPRP